jgi:hypothetical protein
MVSESSTQITNEAWNVEIPLLERHKWQAITVPYQIHGASGDLSLLHQT